MVENVCTLGWIFVMLNNYTVVVHRTKKPCDEGSTPPTDSRKKHDPYQENNKQMNMTEILLNFVKSISALHMKVSLCFYQLVP